MTAEAAATRANAPKSPPEEKFFNIAGPNVPEDHYMLDPLRRVNYDEISRLIDQKQYFVLHAPRGGPSMFGACDARFTPRHG
jgi:hypothetical protein